MNCVRHLSRMFSQSIATSQQSRNGQIVSTWPNRLHTSHSACGQCFSEWPISSHVLHWWYGQSDALLVLCLLELQAEHSLSGQLASVCPWCSHKLQSSASGQFCSECPISSHVLHWWYVQLDDLLVLCRLELHAEHSLSPLQQIDWVIRTQRSSNGREGARCRRRQSIPVSTRGR